MLRARPGLGDMLSISLSCFSGATAGLPNKFFVLIRLESRSTFFIARSDRNREPHLTICPYSDLYVHQVSVRGRERAHSCICLL